MHISLPSVVVSETEWFFKEFIYLRKLESLWCGMFLCAWKEQHFWNYFSLLTCFHLLFKELRPDWKPKLDDESGSYPNMNMYETENCIKDVFVFLTTEEAKVKLVVQEQNTEMKGLFDRTVLTIKRTSGELVGNRLFGHWVHRHTRRKRKCGIENYSFRWIRKV